jgi:hypothetical protein
MKTKTKKPRHTPETPVIATQLSLGLESQEPAVQIGHTYGWTRRVGNKSLFVVGVRPTQKGCHFARRIFGEDISDAEWQQVRQWTPWKEIGIDLDLQQ